MQLCAASGMTKRTRQTLLGRKLILLCLHSSKNLSNMNMCAYEDNYISAQCTSKDLNQILAGISFQLCLRVYLLKLIPLTFMSS
jgi:hypothetical protein